MYGNETVPLSMHQKLIANMRLMHPIDFEQKKSHPATFRKIDFFSQLITPAAFFSGYPINIVAYISFLHIERSS